DTSQWDAPGLGNNLHRISSDQERRQLAIARAIEADRLRPKPSQTPEPAQPEVASSPPQARGEEAAIARLFAQEVPPAFSPAPTPAAQPNTAANATSSDSTPVSTVDAILNLDLPEAELEPDR
ncbi:MAG: hypothetical protein HC840_27175, partial [Leptolyngbyaceae cyanobacterium RM2_2_4]|nr:hypothetical protein [Leptolyngbyaceae cyanobacterium RM2_2_4]